MSDKHPNPHQQQAPVHDSEEAGHERCSRN